MVEYVLKGYKTILNSFRYIDSWFWCRYSLNPYNGCEFACTYCDSRSHKYHLHPKFSQIIYVKTEPGAMLDQRLGRARTLLPDVVGLGGTCDAYQPAEAVYGNTRACLQVLLKYRYPVFISTKSSLILRDLDILKSIAEASWCTVAVTVTTMDSELASFLEPLASDPAERIGVVRRIKRICPSIQAGVNLIPIIPVLADDEPCLREVVSETRKAGADFILFAGGMTMRDRQAEWFLRRLAEDYPSLLRSFLQIYDAEYSDDHGYQGGYEPNPGYAEPINRIMISLCKEHGLRFRVRRYIPEDYRKANYLIAQGLLDEAHLAQITGKPWTNLFWAGQNINNLRTSISELAKARQLRTIRNVGPGIEKRIVAMLEAIESGQAR